MKSFSTIFFSNYLFISMQKKIIIHSFWSTLNMYLLVVHTKKIIIHSFWSTLNMYLLILMTIGSVFFFGTRTFVYKLKNNRKS
jgi:hypothetical protein